MPCVCKRCLRHSRTLGLANTPHSKTAIHKSFRAAAKLWHPDRFEREPGKRSQAEERFKQIQVACRELLEHIESPEIADTGQPSPNGSPPYSASVKTPSDDDLQAISFGGAPGCYTAPHFPPQASDLLAAHLQDNERALAFIDLSGSASREGRFSQYMLLTSHRIFFRDAMQIVSLLWYADLGEINLVDQREDRKPGIWQRIVENLSSTERRYSLRINRHNGLLFCSVAGQADDSVKKVIYNFLLQRKPPKRS